MAETTLFDRPKTTQCDRLLKHFQEGGTVTSLESFNKFKITQLGARISGLEERDHRFSRPRIKLPSGKVVCQYSLKGD